MLKKIVLGLGALIALVLILAATKPKTFKVERKAVMKAPAAKVFAQFNDFHNWAAWSPWEKLDPAMQRTYSGAKSGKGAIYEWKGNNKVGSGRMEITESPAPERIGLDLLFLMPFESRNTTVFSFVKQGEGTEVTWTMEGPNNFFSKLMQVFMSMDKMIGKDFEAGLSNIKAIVEK
jgi:hypothetical protein